MNKPLSRVFGLETEYALAARYFDITDSPRAVNPDLFFNFFPRSHLHNRYSQNVFTENGARIYLDTGFHPEYATPECQGVTTLVLYDKVGERMMERAEILLNRCWQDRSFLAWLLSAPEVISSPHSGPNQFEWKNYPIKIYRNNVSMNTIPDTGEPISWGCHENYLASPIILERLMWLVPHLITRQIYGGAGWLMRGTDSVARFLLAQRPLVISALLGGSSTTHPRPIIHTRDEPHAAPGTWKRLHLILGDANISPWATWLKMGATGLIIGVLEDPDFASGVDFGVSPGEVSVLKAICNDPTCTNTFGFSGRKHTAISVQRFYLDLVRRYYREERSPLSEESARVLQLWQAVLDCIERGDVEALAPYLDNFAKLHLFESGMLGSGALPARASKGFSFQDKVMPDKLFYYLKAIDLSYHRVLREKSVYAAFQRTDACRQLSRRLEGVLPWIAGPLFGDADIERAWFSPPPGRPRWRQRVMRLAEELQELESVTSILVDWSNVQVAKANLANETFKNLDPYSEMTDEVLEAVKRLKN